MKFCKSFFLFFNFYFLFFALALIFSCSGNTDKSGTANSQPSALIINNTDSVSAEGSNPDSTAMEVKTYKVNDSTGKFQGWGYDIYIKGKKTIHQPIIPAVPGNCSFKTESDAKKTGLFALGKMIEEGALPTISIKELDSLGITKIKK